MVRSYSKIERTIKKIASKSRFISLNQLGRVRSGKTSYNLYLIEVTDKEGVLGKKKSVCISAGIHGDEPAGVEVLLRFLKEVGQRSQILKHINITIFPCNNPYGYESGSRTNKNGNDLNREFRKRSPEQEVFFIKRAIAGRSFDLSVELHEDVDSAGFYLYELKKDGEETFGKEIINIISKKYPINLSDEIEGMKADGGIISPKGSESEIKEMILKRRRWPKALYQFSQGTRHCITCETPVNMKMGDRVDMHQLALEYLLKRL